MCVKIIKYSRIDLKNVKQHQDIAILHLTRFQIIWQFAIISLEKIAT